MPIWLGLWLIIFAAWHEKNVPSLRALGGQNPRALLRMAAELGVARVHPGLTLKTWLQPY